MNNTSISYDEQLRNLLSNYDENQISFYKAIVDESDRCFPNEEASFVVTEEIDKYGK